MPKTYRFDDKLSIPTTRRLQDTGQMIAEGAIARTGVLKYRASDLGSMFSDLDPNTVVRVAQLSDDLFDENTLEKFRSAPITIGHPAEDVDTKNMKELGKGTLEGKPFQDGMHLAANLVLSDQEAIDLVNSGVHELSVRAYYTLTRCDDAEDYDAIRTIQSVNHVAIVERGRAGATCRISDAEDGEVEEQPVADVTEIVEPEVVPEPEAQAEPEAPQEPEEPAVEAPVEDDKPSEVEELRKALSDALDRITALEEATKQRLDDEQEEAAGNTPMAKVLKEVSLSDNKPKEPVKSAAELARERMIARYAHI